MSNLKPCPFCGSEVRLSEREGLLGITCAEGSPCSGSGLFIVFGVNQKEKATETWNTRVPDALEDK